MIGAVEELMHDGVAQRVFPGAVLWVASRGEVLIHRPFGWADLFRPRPVMRETLFDLASLTKPLATALAAMVLVQQGRLDLDRPLREYWPEWAGGGRERITSRHLLSHCAGVPAWRPYFFRLLRFPPGRRESLLKQLLLAEPLVAQPGERVLYSDLGFWMLKWLIEELAGQPLDRLLASSVWKPLGIDGIHYSDPARVQPVENYAATELCPWRNRLLRGEVHDDHAHVVGGVAGHAGLFGTAQEVGRMLQGLLDIDQNSAVHGVVDRRVLQTFLQKQACGTRALGFDTPAACGSSAGKHFSPDSVGHLGFTGTSFWMDRRRAVIVVLLTNRVHPTRYNRRIQVFRPRLHDRVMAALAGDS